MQYLEDGNIVKIPFPDIYSGPYRDNDPYACKHLYIYFNLIIDFNLFKTV